MHALVFAAYVVHFATVFTGILVLGLTVPQTHVVHERRHVPHTRLHKRMAPHAVLPMRIGLRQNRTALASAEAWLMEVADPASPKYGQHWSADEVVAAFRPGDEPVAAVADWLVGAGIARDQLTLSGNKAWFAFDATVAEAEALLHTQYLHDGGGVDADGGGPAGPGAAVGCNVYHLPKHVQPHVDYVTPGLKTTMMDLRPSRARKRSGSPGGAKRRPGDKKLDASRRKRPKSHTFKGRLPGYELEQPTRQGSNESELADCDLVITPPCIRALYQFDALDPDAMVSSNNSLGFFEGGDFYAQEDLDLFFSTFTPYIPTGTHPILNSIDGGEAPVDIFDVGGESELDFQTAYPIIYPQTITLYQVGDLYYSTSTNGTEFGIFNTFLDALDGSYCTYSAFGETGDDPVLDPTYPDPNGYTGPLMCGVYEPTNVISISYGVYENDLPEYYQKRQCNEWLKLGLQGTSVITASGDTGVGGYPHGTYGDGPYYGCLRDDDVFAPLQLNNCPWVTDVGATKVYEGRTVFEPESAAYDPDPDFNYSSSGGFSNMFPIPDYQQAAIASYFADHEPPYPYYYDGKYQNATNGGLYNRNGRGSPDVAANGDKIAIFVQGELTLGSGTSASAPIFASLLTRILEERLAVGKGPLGFVNPALYAHPEVLNDITNGSNPGCGTGGFDAVEGWDPVTGLGTPNYPKMLDLFLSLP